MFKPKPSYSYGDIGLVPNKLSTTASRSTGVDPSLDFLGTPLDLPILLAPMETVVGYDMAYQIRCMGGQAVIPRLNNLHMTIGLVHKLLGNINLNELIVSIPAKGGQEWFNKFLDMGITKFCIDVANGFATNVEEAVKFIKANSKDVKIITGNIASYEGYLFLQQLGVDAIRVGIGGGGVCTTSVATGVGVGQATVVREIARWRQDQINFFGETPDNHYPAIIADGGVTCPGDVAKAIALGADVVMMGSKFAGAEESPGKVLKIDGQLYKQLAGQASRTIKGQNQYVEGADKVVPYTGGVKKTWDAYEEGIRSSMSYMGCGTLEELRYLDDEDFTLLAGAAKAERDVHA